MKREELVGGILAVVDRDVRSKYRSTKGRQSNLGKGSDCGECLAG